MDNYFANINAIARGKGSSQARYEGCQMCKEEEDQMETEQDESTNRKER